MVDEALLLEKLKAIEDKMDSLQDTEQLTELDIINLKNEIEKIKIGTAAYIPEDIEEKVRRLEKLAEDTSIFEEWKRALKEMEILREIVEKLPVDGKTVSEIPSDHKEQIENLKQMIVDSKTGGTDPELIRRIEDLETRVRSIKPVRIPQDVQGHVESINDIREKLDSLSQEILQIKKSGGEQKPLPPIMDDIAELKSSVISLEDELTGLKTNMPGDEEDTEILKVKIAALLSRLEVLEQRSGDNKNLSEINKKIESVADRLNELSKGADNTGIQGLEKEIDSLFSKIDVNDSKINTVFEDMNKKLSTINNKLKSLSSASTPLEIEELKKSLKDVQTKLVKIDSKPKPPNQPSVDIESLKKELVSLKSGLEQAVTKQEFLDFEQNLIPPKIPDTKDLEEAMKRGIKLEKEIEKINKKSQQIQSFLKRNEDIDKIKEDVKKLIKENNDLKKAIPSVKNKIPGPPSGVPAKLLQPDMSKYSDQLEYLRKNQLRNEGELSKRMSELRNKIVENEKRIENVMDEMGKALKNLHEGPLPPGSDGNANRLLKEINILRKDLDTRITEKTVKDFENEVYRELETMNKTIRDSIRENSEYAKKVDIEFSAIEEKMKNLESGHETVKNIDPSNLMREIEMLKAKQKWVEDNIQHFNLEPLHEKITDIERRLDMLKINSPLIIE